MNTILKYFTSLAFAFLWIGQVSAQGNFSGTIETSTTDHFANTKTRSSLLLKDGDARLNFTSQTKDGEQAMSMLSRKGANAVQILYDNADGGANGYFEVPIASIKMGDKNFVFNSVNVQEGAKMISGHNCKRYLFEGPNANAYVWVGNVEGLENGNIPEGIPFNGLLPAMQSNGIAGIPFEYTITATAGGAVVTQSIISVTRGEISSEEFRLESGSEVWTPPGKISD